MVDTYESLASDLLEWIKQSAVILNDRKFANSLAGVQQQLQAFNAYRTMEKPPKSASFTLRSAFFLTPPLPCRRSSCSAQTSALLVDALLPVFLFRFTEKGNLEVLLFTIQSKMRANNQKVYTPREGKLISDINKVSGAQTPTGNFDGIGIRTC